MSPSSNTLVVSSGPLAEISVLDGSMNTVARSVGELREDLAPGLYKIRVRNGPSPEVAEQFVSLDQNRTMSIDAPPIFSPIPLEGTTRSHEYHMSRAVDSSRNPQFSFGQGSGLFVFAREWSATGTGAHNNPAEGLEIIDETGKLLAEVGKTATIELSNDPSAAWCATVSPGAYRLRFALADGSIIERALFASPGCQTQIFILLSTSISSPAAKAYPNLAGGAVIMSPKFQFDPQDRGTQLGEIARYALTQKRRVLNDQLRREIVNEKFADPMLGLLGAHLILRDEPDNATLFETVTGNLLRLLGPDHPDLRLLCLRRRAPLLGMRRSLESPPMLRASWDLAVEASLENPNSFPEAGSVADIADKIVPTTAWLVWRREPALEHPGASEIGSPLALSVREFVAARARLETSRLAARGVIGRVSSAIYNYLSAGWHMLRGTPRPTSPMPSLSDDDKAELARVLGIPGPRLESLLKKIFD